MARTTNEEMAKVVRMPGARGKTDRQAKRPGNRARVDELIGKPPRGLSRAERDLWYTRAAGYAKLKPSSRGFLVEYMAIQSDIARLERALDAAHEGDEIGRLTSKGHARVLQMRKQCATLLSQLAADLVRKT